MKRFALVASLAAMLTSPVFAQSVDSGGTLATDGARKEGQDAGKDTSSVRVVFKDAPSLRIGKVLRVDLHVRLQGDVSSSSSNVEGDQAFMDLSRRRVGIEGRILKTIEFQIERELGQNDPWRDVLVDVQLFDRVQVRGGQFKIPFSLDQLTGPTRLDFVYRSRLADDLAPGRDRGVAVHGRFKSRGLRYHAGFFQHDGDNARFGRNPGAGTTIAGRMTLRPFHGPAARPTLKRLELAADMTIGNVPEGLNALKGRTTLGARLSEPVYVNGRRLRAGVDAAWAAGPFSLKGELLRVSDERRGQGLLGDDLPSLLSRGWYISGAWAITGEPNVGAIEPSRPLFHGGIGAVELAARYEGISFRSARPRGDASVQADDPPSASPRAPNLLGSTDRVWTFGVNWDLNRWAKVQVNAIRERSGKTSHEPTANVSTVWGGLCRLQFVL